MVSGGRGAAFIAFAVAAATIALLMLVLAVVVGAAREGLIERLKAGTGQIKQWSGVVLLLVGTWLIILAVWAEFFARLFPV